MSNSDIYSSVKTKIGMKKVHIRVKSRAVLHLTEQFFQSLTHLRNRKWEVSFYFLTSASQWCAGHTLPNTHWAGPSNLPGDVDTQAGDLPNFKCFPFLIRHSFKSTSVPGSVWGLCQRWNCRDPRQCNQKAQGLEVPCRLGYQQEDCKNAGT